MKAKFFEFNGQMEIVLENGNVIAANESEAKVDFLNRVTGEVDAEFMENLEVTEVTVSSLKKKASKALVAAFGKSTGVQAELIKSVLESRGVSVGESTEEETDEEEEAVEAPKKEKKAKAVKEPKEKISLGDALDIAKEMRVNIGKVIEFSSFRKGETITAEIKQVVVDIRENRIYFRVHELSTGKLYHTSIYNSSVVINEETARVAEEKAAAQKAKEEEKAKKKAKKKAEVETAEEIQD